MSELRYIDHTADKGMEISADSPGELFQVALEGMGRLKKESLFTPGNNPTETMDLTIESPDRTALLIDFLSEVLTLSHIHRVVFTRLDTDSITDTRLTGTIHGHRVEDFDEDIKAVTHYQADIRRDDKGLYSTRIVFDI